MAHDVVFVELSTPDGCIGLGEAAPSSTYGDTPDSVVGFLTRVNPERLDFTCLPESMAYLESLAPVSQPALCALNIALVDGAARRAGCPVHRFLGLGFTPGKHRTSVTIGIDTPDKMAQKTREAAAFPILKLKLGSPADRENFEAVRSEAPGKRIRVDANAAWTSREEALRRIEWLATDGGVEFVEQPMPADTPWDDLIWLRERSPLPLFADESYHLAKDASACARAFHGVNVKLVKTGGISAGKTALEAARNLGLQTMIGCMLESSLLISAAAHLAELADHLDLDSPILITNDPYEGVHLNGGILSFPDTLPTTGLQVRPRDPSGPTS